MMKFILGILAGIILVVAVVLLYFTSGMAPAGTADPPMPFEKWMAKTALSARIRREMPGTLKLPVRYTSAFEIIPLSAGSRGYSE